MRKSSELLNWYFNPSDFKYRANHLFSRDTKDAFKSAILNMEKIGVISSNSEINLKEHHMEFVYRQFQMNRNKEPSFFSSFFSKRDVRILLWTLDYQPDETSEMILFSKYFDNALEVIENGWKDSYIIGLWHVLIRNWSKLLSFLPQRISLIKILRTKCNNYAGARRDLSAISSNISLFLKIDSPHRYALQLANDKVPVNQAHLIVNQTETILIYEFFFLMILEYIEIVDLNKVQKDWILTLYQFLLKHNSKKTDLIVCSFLINNLSSGDQLEIVKNQTVSVIGDPIMKHQWRLSGLTEDEEKSIESARLKLNLLLNIEFIEVFFNKLVIDERRKKYWLKFIDRIEDIKFVGNRVNHKYLKSIEGISKYVDSRYKTTRRNQSTCALVIYSKQFVFVEFTDTGALYIYEQKNFTTNLNAISSMDKLKKWSSSVYACRNSEQSGYVNLRREGRITHQGEWELRVDSWMNKFYYD
jgi:hypothetical protein